MKISNLILILSLLTFSLFTQAQTTSVTVEKSGDEVIVTTTEINQEGRVTGIDYKYYNAGEFAEFALSVNNPAQIDVAKKEREILVQNRDINLLRRYVIDTLSFNYDSLQTVRFGQAILGNSTLIERNGTVTTSPVEISINANNPRALRITDDTGRAGNLIFEYSEKFEIRNFWPEFVTFINVGGDRWRGTLSDGTAVVIRR